MLESACQINSFGGYIAHSGMTSTIAFEYDTYGNTSFGDVSDISLSIHDCSVNACSHNEDANSSQVIVNQSNYKNDIQIRIDYDYLTKIVQLTTITNTVSRHIPNFSNFNRFRIGFFSVWSYGYVIQITSAYYCRTNRNKVVFTGTNGKYIFKINQVEISRGFINSYSPIEIALYPEAFDSLYEFIITKDSSVSNPMFIATFHYDDEKLKYKKKNSSRTWFAGFLPAIEKTFPSTISGIIGTTAIWDINDSTDVVLTTFISKSTVIFPIGGTCT